MFGFERKSGTSQLKARVEKIASASKPSMNIEELLTAPTSDVELSSLITRYQEIRAFQESGNSVGLRDSHQLTELENKIEARAKEIGFLQ